ncbi:hypothetical protein DYQ86_16310 [Acidobacteria bacterium AB60]|nr:hypothetical protein DYQ86_16310 [Acidobacteria bacterium AB60]
MDTLGTYLCMDCGLEWDRTPLCSMCRIEREIKAIVTDYRESLTVTPFEARQMAHLCDQLLTESLFGKVSA